MTLPRQTGADRRWIWALALLSLAVLATARLALAYVPPAVSPRVNIRWADNVDDPARVDLERRLQLFAGEHRDGTTWLYDLGDPTPRGVKELIAHRSVADTFHIDRRLGIVSEDAPRGTTRIGDGRLSAWREWGIFDWAARIALSVLSVSAIWLGTAVWGARRSALSPD